MDSDSYTSTFYTPSFENRHSEHHGIYVSKPLVFSSEEPNSLGLWVWPGRMVNRKGSHPNSLDQMHLLSLFSVFLSDSSMGQETQQLCTKERLVIVWKRVSFGLGCFCYFCLGWNKTSWSGMSSSLGLWVSVLRLSLWLTPGRIANSGSSLNDLSHRIMQN